MKSMNEAQRYGSGLTYARRYSVLMFLGLVCDEDKKLETQTPPESAKRWEGLEEDLNIKDLADEFRKLYPKEDQERILKGLGYSRAEDIGIKDLQKYVNFAKYGKK